MRCSVRIAVMCAVVAAAPVWAHHSHGAYEDPFTDLEGVVKELHMVVPHSWIYLEVNGNDGEAEIWALEAAGRTGLRKIGVTPEYVKVGDTIKARCQQLRDGSNGCLVRFLKAQDGTVKAWDGGDAVPPSDFLNMRATSLVSAALTLLCATPAVAEWTDYTSRDDLFTCNFPAEPRVTNATFASEYGVDLPARVYAAADGASRYSMTVVDYRSIEKLHAARSGGCAQGVGDCLSDRRPVPRWKQDLAGAITYATSQLVQRDAEVTFLATGWMDWVEGHTVQLTNADESRTYASIYMHENRLYIMEGTVPPGAIEPALFQQSLGWIDENGLGIRYGSIYKNGYPAPPRVPQVE